MMEIETKVKLICDGPQCTTKPLEWIQEKPDTCPDTIHHWFSIVLSDKRDFAFCSKSCALDWFRLSYQRVKSPKEKELDAQEAAKQKVIPFSVPVPELEPSAETELKIPAPTALTHSYSDIGGYEKYPEDKVISIEVGDKFRSAKEEACVS